MYNNGEMRAHAAGNELGGLISQHAQRQRESISASACVADAGRVKPMLDVEYDQLAQATVELDQLVLWLIQRIQPICQPSPVGNATEGPGSREPDAPTSELRTKLKNLRGLVEGISSRIAAVRYTIEV